MAAMTMTIEPVAPFNGLDVMVARDEGLFAEAGLDLRVASLPAAERARTELGTRGHPRSSQGKLLERGAAGMFQA